MVELTLHGKLVSSVFGLLRIHPRSLDAFVLLGGFVRRFQRVYPLAQ
jgi:hypothetical protein